MSKSTTTEVVNAHGGEVISSAVIGIVLATICQALRIYVRAFMTGSFGVDDWVLLAAFVTFSTLSALAITYGVNVGGDGIFDNQTRVFLVLEWHTFFYSVDQSFLKAALAAFYLRVLPKVSWQRKVVLISTSVFICWTLIVAFIYLFQCGNPMDMDSTNCVNGNTLLIMSYVQAAFNALMDWLLTLLPITVISRTQMSSRTKISVILIMLLGAAASVISIVRISYLNTPDTDGPEVYGPLAKLMIMSYWENCIGQVVICLAALRPLVRIVFKGSKTSTYGPTGATPTAGATSKQSKLQTGIAVEHTYQVEDNISMDELELLDRSTRPNKDEIVQV